jgi:hypothetical protein
MSSGTGGRGATPAPSLRVAPKAARSDHEDACFLADGYGLTPDDWQSDVLSDWMGRTRAGKWAAGVCGLSVARQNGKNACIEIRELFGMIELGEKFLHTAHQVKTARKAFKRLQHFFGEDVNDPHAKFPELNALVTELRKTNGQEAIVLSNGASIEFVARSRGSARGYTVDVLVLDEAQELNDEQLEALKPTISAAPTRNPQTIYTGTPPNPEKGQLGLVFRRVRARAKAKRPRIAFTDYGVPDGPMPDVDDKAVWRQTNPATVVGRLLMSAIEDERADMSDDGFARERCGWWGDPDDSNGTGVFSPGKWAKLAADREEAPIPASLGIAADVDQVWLSLGAASTDETPHLGSVLRVRADEQLEHFVAEVARIQSENNYLPVAIDAKGPAGYLIEYLEEAGVTLSLGGLDDLVQASAGLHRAVEDGTVEHGDYDALNAAAAAAGWRNIGDRRVFARRFGEISMLEAVAWALWVTKREPTYDIEDSYL